MPLPHERRGPVGRGEEEDAAVALAVARRDVGRPVPARDAQVRFRRPQRFVPFCDFIEQAHQRVRAVPANRHVIIEIQRPILVQG